MPFIYIFAMEYKCRYFGEYEKMLKLWQSCGVLLFNAILTETG